MKPPPKKNFRGTGQKTNKNNKKNEQAGWVTKQKYKSRTVTSFTGVGTAFFYKSLRKIKNEVFNKPGRIIYIY